MECEGCGTTLKVENGDQDKLCLSCWLDDQPVAFPRDQWEVAIGTPDGWMTIG